MLISALPCHQVLHKSAWMAHLLAQFGWASFPCRPAHQGPSSHWWQDWPMCGGVVCASVQRRTETVPVARKVNKHIYYRRIDQLKIGIVILLCTYLSQNFFCHQVDAPVLRPQVYFSLEPGRLANYEAVPEAGAWAFAVIGRTGHTTSPSAAVVTTSTTTAAASTATVVAEGCCCPANRRLRVVGGSPGSSPRHLLGLHFGLHLLDLSVAATCQSPKVCLSGRYQIRNVYGY